ncbi:holin [Vibrio phage D81]
MKITLIDDIKNCWKYSSFQIAMLLIIMEGINRFLSGTPQNWQEWTQLVLVILLPFFRLVKQNVGTKQ